MHKNTSMADLSSCADAVCVHCHVRSASKRPDEFRTTCFLLNIKHVRTYRRGKRRAHISPSRHPSCSTADEDEE